MDFSNYKFHCYSLGALMSDSKTGPLTPIQEAKLKELSERKKNSNDLTDNQENDLQKLIAKRDNDNPDSILGETAKKHLIEIYIEEVYNRTKDISTKYIEKGLHVEEDSLTLYSRVKKKIFFKNETRLENDFITGEADTFDELDYKKAKEVIDMKSSWDLFTFMANKIKPINSDYDWQLQGYMDLFKLQRAKLAYCLNDTPKSLIEAEKRKILYQMGLTLDEAINNPFYIKACEAIESNLTFQDIPLNERVYEITLEKNPAKIEALYKRIPIARKWLNDFAKKELKRVSHHDDYGKLLAKAA